MKYNYNVDFFKHQSRDLAYFLGFVMADGYVCKKGIRISINRKDNCILEYFRNLICPEMRIYEYDHICSLSKYNTRCYYNRLSISCRAIIDIIINEYKISSPKTGKEFIPGKLDQIFIPDFLRGLFDGDGCVTLKSQRPIHSNIVSASQDFLNQIRIYLGFGNVNRSKKIFAINFSSMDSLKLRSILYNNEPFALARKKDIFFSVDKSDIKVQRLTQSELSIISDTSKSVNELSKLLNRDKANIYRKIREYDLREIETCRQFTTAEIDILKNTFDKQQPTKSIENLAKLLNRSIRSIDGKVGRLKLRGKFT